MTWILATFLLVVVSAQFLPIHRGEFETTINGYRFQFHDEFHLLLILHGLDCYVSDVPTGSSAEKNLLEESTRKAAYAKIISLIEAGKDMSRTDLDKVHSTYGDMLLRALCFRSEIFNLDISSIN